MYAKIFRQIYDSTLANDWQALITFQQFLVLADYHGEVDMTISAISRVTGIPIDIITDGINKLLEVDAESRSPEEEGRRIIPIDPHRSWGWIIVNFKTYRAFTDKETKREQTKIRVQRHRKLKAGLPTELKRLVTTCNDTKRLVTTCNDTKRHIDTDTDTDTKKKENTSSVEVEKKPSTSAAMEWPENGDIVSKNLKDFLLKQPYFKDNYQQQLLHYEWWDNLATVINGIDIKWIDIEFAKMRKWIIDNPKRSPTVRGFRKFVGGWLERGYEKERRFKA